jgi:septal ring factor EnvC (AmiA/AmiB activator)
LSTVVAITSTNNATDSLQSVLSRARIERARSRADQAEAQASELRVQADAAEQEAQQRKREVRALQTQTTNGTSAYAGEARGALLGRILNVRV